MSPPFRGAGKRALVLSLPERALRAAKGDKPGRRVLRFLAGTGLLLGMQTAIACMGMRAYGRRPLGTADLLTALRACCGALLAGFGLAGERPHGRAGALPVVLVATGVVSDWIDGPLARRAGVGGPLGKLLDLESDSALTLGAALAATGSRALPPVSLVAPAGRYALPLAAALRGSYATADLGSRWWARAAGVAQMGVLTLALTPIVRDRSRELLRPAAPVVAVAQLCTLLVLLGRVAGRWREGDRSGRDAVGGGTTRRR